MPLQVFGTPPAKRPSFGAKISEGIGRGLQSAQSEYDKYKALEAQKSEDQFLSQVLGYDVSGVSSDLKKILVQETMKEQAKMNQLQQKQDFLSQIFGGGGLSQGQRGLESGFEGEEPGIPENQEQMGGYNPANITDAQIAAASVMDPVLGRELREAKNTALKERRHQESLERGEERYKQEKQTAKERSYFKMNEPKVMQLADNQRKLEVEKARYERLNELFSQSEKFPSPILASLMTKEGNIRDVAYSQLSPEAQEAVKLIIDSTSNIKDTYGARVTNFDLQTYLKKLPSLLNSEEGKARVLRDLQIMNDLNLLHTGGIQEVFDEAGGTDQIPFSKAESLYKKKYGDLEKAMLEEFAVPKQKVYDVLPDPRKFLGLEMEDPDTGEVFISDGKTWKLKE